MSERQIVEAGTVQVPGARLSFEVRGSGPVLLCITGGPTAAGENSGEQMARRATAALAERWRTTLTTSPADPAAGAADPHEFANRLHEALGD
jgi:hypothetical protein